MENSTPQTKPRTAPVDYARAIKVICIGAGMSGILCGIRFPQRISNLHLTIYDKNDEVGGVCYPGVTCDVPSHCFQYIFANKGYWPGSAVHQRATLAHPRFEDFEYCSFEDGEEDCLAWMGHGMVAATMADTSTTGSLDEVDIPRRCRRTWRS